MGSVHNSILGVGEWFSSPDLCRGEPVVVGMALGCSPGKGGPPSKGDPDSCADDLDNSMQATSRGLFTQVLKAALNSATINCFYICVCVCVYAPKYV